MTDDNKIYTIDWIMFQFSGYNIYNKCITFNQINLLEYFVRFAKCYEMRTKKKNLKLQCNDFRMLYNRSVRVSCVAKQEDQM